MLTLEYVKKVCTDPEMIAMREAISSTGVPKLDKRNAFAEAITAEFDQIAGAPDVTSGVGRSVYFLNEAHTEYIRLDGSAVFHVVVDENGHAFNKVELFDNLVLIKDGVYVANNN